MQPFEAYFQKWLKSGHGVPHYKLNSVPHCADYLIQFQDSFLIELKNHKRFSYSAWMKKQKEQYDRLWEWNNAFILQCPDRSHFRNFELYHIGTHRGTSPGRRFKHLLHLRKNVVSLYYEHLAAFM